MRGRGRGGHGRGRGRGRGKVLFLESIMASKTVICLWQLLSFVYYFY